MLPARAEQVVQLGPRRIFVGRATEDHVREHERVRAGPADHGRLQAVVLDVDADRDHQDVGRDIVESERLGAGGDRGLLPPSRRLVALAGRRFPARPRARAAVSHAFRLETPTF